MDDMRRRAPQPAPRRAISRREFLGLSTITAGLVAAGANPVAVDAVVTAAMGLDPLAGPPTQPFLRGDNYRSLARTLGLGSNRLPEIEVVGAAVDDIRCPFEPAWEM